MQAGERDVDLKIPGQRERDGAAVSGGKRMRNQRLLRGCGEREKKKQDEHAAGHAASVAGDVHRRQVHAALRRSANGLVQCEAEACVQLATTVAGEGEDAAVELLRDPAFFQGEMKQGCAKCASQVGTALAPVQTRVGEAAAEIAGSVDVDTERSEGAGAFGGEAVGVLTRVIGAAAIGLCIECNPAQGGEAIVQRDAGGASHVVVAGAREAQRAGCARDVRIMRSAGKHAEAFKGGRDIAAMQAVVAALALREHFDELRRAEALQVHAGGGGRDNSNGGELGRGAGAAIHEARKHASACRLADGGGDVRNGKAGFC